MIVSLAIGLPFTLLANMQSRFRPEQVLASPVNIGMFAVAAACFTAMGGAFGGRNGTIASALVSSVVWISVVAIVTDGKDIPLLVIHCFVSLLVVASILGTVVLRKESRTHDPSDTVTQLVTLKQAMRAERVGDRMSDRMSDLRGEMQDDQEPTDVDMLDN